MIRTIHLKIVSVILSIAVLIFSYPLSFLEWNIDEDLTMNDAFTNLKATQIDDKSVYAVNETFDMFNYFGLTYSSDGYCKGHIVFSTLRNKIAEEDFFLEPGENKEFFSFVDGVRDAVKHKGIKTISVKNLTGENFELKSVKTFNRKIDDRIVYFSNDYYKIGIDLQWGGALSYLEDLTHNVEAVVKDGHTKVDSNASQRYGEQVVNANVNLINCMDPGRLVQQSYYGPREAEGYISGTYNGENWTYNPVQGGNMFCDSSKIVDYRMSDDTLYVKCRPMDWSMTKEWITPSYMEAWYELSDNNVYVKCRFTDFSGYPECSQATELPAFYTIEPLQNFYYYSGNNPWQDEELSVDKDLFFWAEDYQRHSFFNLTEKWVAFAGDFDDSFGIGVYSPSQKDLFALAGIYMRNTTYTDNPAVEGGCSYVAIQYADQLVFKTYSAFEYDYYISTGTVNEIRNNFKEINDK